MGIVTNGLLAYWNTKQGADGQKWQNISPNTPGQFNASVFGAIFQTDKYSFDGVDDYIDVPNLGISGKSYTIEVLFYWNESGSATLPTLVGYDSDHRVVIQKTTKFLRSYYNGAMTGVTAISDTGLRHGYVEYDHATKTMRLYLNNVLEKSSTMSVDHAWNAAFRIGQTGTSVGTNFMGQIAAVRFYDRLLTQQERDQNFAEGTNVGLGSTAITHNAGASLSAVASLSSTGEIATIGTIHSATVNLTGVASVTSDAIRTQHATLNLSGVAGITAQGIRVTSGNAQATAVGTASATGGVTVNSSGTLNGTTTIAAAGLLTLFGSANLTSDTGVSASAVITQYGVGTLSAGAQISANPTNTKTATATLSANGVISISTDSTKLAIASLSASASIVADGTRIITSSAIAQGSATISVQAGIVFGGVAAIVAAGTVIASGDVRSVVRAAGAVLSATSSVTAIGSRTAIADVVLLAVGTFLATAGEQYRQYLTSEIVIRRKIAQGTTVSRRGRSAINVTRRTTGEVSI